MRNWREMRSVREGRGCPGTAFSLIELLVVVAIIGLLTSISLPALKGLGKSNLLAATNRQLLDDLALARLLAINNRATVHLAFLTPAMVNTRFLKALGPDDLARAQRLLEGQYTAYALFSRRSVGSQPGQLEPRYLTDWKFLPAGMIFETNQFSLSSGTFGPGRSRRPPLNRVPINFPRAADFPLMLPAISFNPQGQLKDGRDRILTYMEGVTVLPRDANGNVIPAVAEVVDKSAGQRHHLLIRWLTGRARTLGTESLP